MVQNIPQKQRKKIYFFSDAHLGDSAQKENRQREKLLIKFLNYVLRDGEQLYIVGDLFDYWFEYNSVVPKGYVRLLGKLAELQDRGVKITYLTGNHDFWMKNYLTEEIGMEICHDFLERSIHGKRFLISHGDGLSEKDKGYRVLKRILRNKTNIYLYSMLHPDLASKLARWSSRTSRNHGGNRQLEEQEMTRFAREKIEEGFQFIVMGHNHHPIYRNFGKGSYVNLGDWINKYSYAVFDGLDLHLRRWRDHSKTSPKRKKPHPRKKLKTDG